MKTPDEWADIVSMPDWREKYRHIEDGMRQLSASLLKDDDLSTTEYFTMLFKDCDAATKDEGMAKAMKVAKHVTDLRTARQETATKGYNVGKSITRYRWSYVPYKACLPTSTKAPPPDGTSLVTRVADLEAKVMRLEALLTPASII